MAARSNIVDKRLGLGRLGLHPTHHLPDLVVRHDPGHRRVGAHNLDAAAALRCVAFDRLDGLRNALGRAYVVRTSHPGSGRVGTAQA